MQRLPGLVLALSLPLLAIAAPGSSLAQAPPATGQASPVPPKAKAEAAARKTAKAKGLPATNRAKQGSAGPGGAGGRAAARVTPGKSPSPALPPAGDQSFLYSDYSKAPPVSAGAPDYVTSGSSHFNQPWFMSIYDKLGNWPP